MITSEQGAVNRLTHEVYIRTLRSDEQYIDRAQTKVSHIQGSNSSVETEAAALKITRTRSAYFNSMQNPPNKRIFVKLIILDLLRSFESHRNLVLTQSVDTNERDCAHTGFTAGLLHWIAFVCAGVHVIEASVLLSLKTDKSGQMQKAKVWRI